MSLRGYPTSSRAPPAAQRAGVEFQAFPRQRQANRAVLLESAREPCRAPDAEIAYADVPADPGPTRRAARVYSLDSPTK